MSVLRRFFWKSLWFALLRSRQDKRARLVLLSIAALLLWGIAEVWMVFILPARDGHGLFQMIFNGVVVAAGFVASTLIRRSNQKHAELLNFSLTGQNERQIPEQVSSTVRQYLEDRAVIAASLLARAGGEAYLENNEVPPGAEVVTRQIQNSRLRELGLWEKLQPGESALASAADGLWTAEQRMKCIAWCEQLRLLRWTLGIDAELVPLSHYPETEYSVANLPLRGSTLARSAGDTPASWDLRVERDTAFGYFARVIAELKGRSLITDDAELEGWAEELRRDSLGPSVDFLAGAKTIGELSENRLRLLGLIAHARFQFAEYLVDQLQSTEPLPFPEGQWD
jgi:hypothetical protein